MSNWKIDKNDNLVLVEGEYKEEIGEKRKVVNPIDYLTLIIGARDIKYLLSDNKNILDNENTSLYPIYSQFMLQFILYLLTFHFPFLGTMFDFKPHRKYGVFSQTFHDILFNMYNKRPILHTHYTDLRNVKPSNTYSFANRMFETLQMPKFIIPKRYLSIENNDDKLYVKDNIKSITKYNEKNKPYNMTQLIGPFKTDVLLYLTQFYFNYYNEYYEDLIKTGRRIKDHFTYIDKQKMTLDIGVDEELIEKISANIRLFHGKEVKIKNLKLYCRDYGFWDNEKELHEFFLKSILIRRNPKHRLNTRLNRTNGIYLLPKGAGRFKELLKGEILRNGKLENYIDITPKLLYIHLKNNPHPKKGALIKHLDFKNNKPFLLDSKFIELANLIYKNHPLHRFVFYAQSYTKLFNQYGDKLVFLLLAEYFPTYFNFNLFKNRAVRRTEYHITNRRKEGSKMSFECFERLFFKKKRIDTKWFENFVNTLVYDRIMDKKTGQYLLAKYSL